MYRRNVLVSFFIASASVLLFEMVQIRVFAYSLTPILAFAGISLAMTGFGIGAMVLSLFPSMGRRDTRWTLSILGILQSTAMVLSLVLLARSSWQVILGFQDSVFPLLLKILIPSTVPYFFMGLFLAILFSAAKAAVGKLYFANLFGSGIGCLLIVVLLTPLGAEKLILVAAILSTIASALLAMPQHKKLTAIAALLIAIEAGAMGFAEEIFPFAPDPLDAVGYNIRAAHYNKEPPPESEFSEWNIVGKVDVWNLKVERVSVPEKLDLRILAVDSGATTQLIEGPDIEGWGKDLFTDTVYGIAYAVRPEVDDVLVIGAGGGIDVHTALHWNAKRVFAVEINSSTVGAVAGPFAEFLGWPQLDERVQIINSDGRNYIKSTALKFDVIQMTGVDTMTVYATGSINMAEDYLYTVEAFEDYLKSLKPEGIINVLRFGQDHIRLSTIATRALLNRGVKDPGRHIVAFKQSETAGVLIKKQPFTDEEIASLTQYTARTERSKLSIPHFEKWRFYIGDPMQLIYLPGVRSTTEFNRLFNLARNKYASLNTVYESGTLSVPTDNNPYYMLGDWLRAEDHPMKFREAISVMTTFWGAIVGIAAALILLPVFFLKRRAISWRPMLWVLPYFFGIGLSFMLVEICIIHIFAIFVGSPGASLAVVLTSILISSGVGSYVTGLLKAAPEKKIIIAGAVLVFSALAILFFAESIFDALWPLGLGTVPRGIIVGVMIAPMGFAMGWFFPSGLTALERYFSTSNLVPWAVSINAFASVLGSVAALPISMYFGFRALFIVGIVCYAIVTVITGELFYGRKPA